MLSAVEIGFNFQTIFLCATVFLILTWYLRGPRNLPPGPWGWPLLGYLPNLAIALYRTDLHLHQLLEKMSKDQGSVFSMYIGGKLVVVLHKFTTVKEAFRNPHLIDRPPSPVLIDFGAKDGRLEHASEFLNLIF